MDYGWCRGTARLGGSVWVLCGRCGDEEWWWKSAEMEEEWFLRLWMGFDEFWESVWLTTRRFI